MVARVALHGMCQDNNEPIRSFSAWIQGQAGVCKYNVTCRLPRSYSERCPGSWDLRPEIQLDLLGDAKQDMTLELMLKFIESKESGKHFAS